VVIHFWGIYSINNLKSVIKNKFRFCGGLIDDIKRKAPWYLSDFRDGLNFQCLSSVMFMYFACLAPIITFGGLLGSATDDNMVKKIKKKNTFFIMIIIDNCEFKI
jgi:hypothetical protein